VSVDNVERVDVGVGVDIRETRGRGRSGNLDRLDRAITAEKRTEKLKRGVAVVPGDIRLPSAFREFDTDARLCHD
jgi:hypothetical protein